MDITHLRKAFGFIAKGMAEKEKLLSSKHTEYPYSKDLQRGINMFLAASREMGLTGENVFLYADESSFLKHYLTKPICEWFDDWNEEAMQSNNIREELFYSYDAFAIKRGKADIYSVTEECMDFLSLQESNIVEGTDEHTLYELMVALSQEDYCVTRKFIIQYPIITIEERRNLLEQYAENLKIREIIKIAYEEFEDKGFRCPCCGWTMMQNEDGYSCHSNHCLEHLPEIQPEMAIDGSSQPLYRLKKGIMLYFAVPGKLEMDIANYCGKKGLEYVLWPYMDTFDIEIRFPGGEIWEIDAKAYRNPVSLSAKIKQDNGFPSGNYSKGFYVVPTEFTKSKNNYTAVVSKAISQSNVKCITLNQLKRRINSKAGEKK